MKKRSKQFSKEKEKDRVNILVGEFIYSCRDERGYSQDSLGEPHYVSGVENGKISLKITRFVEMVKILKPPKSKILQLFENLGLFNE